MKVPIQNSKCAFRFARGNEGGEESGVLPHFAHHVYGAWDMSQFLLNLYTLSTGEGLVGCRRGLKGNSVHLISIAFSQKPQTRGQWTL